MAGDKDKLFLAAVLDKRFLQVHSVDPRHPHIDNHACGSGMLFALEEIGCRLKRFAFVPRRP